MATMKNHGGRVMTISNDSHVNTRSVASRDAKEIETLRNQAGAFAAKMIRSETALGNPVLRRDYELLQKGHAFYLTQFFGQKEDYSILKQLSKDLESHATGLVNWSQHFKHENPEFSQTFREITTRIGEYFDLDIYATRLNFYPNNSSWKPFHHDSHAYGGRKLREDLTVGASFGATRSLAFRHVESGHQFEFPQCNSDVFAFTTKVNTVFQHGVPKETTYKSGPRFSVIAWGRRRTINQRNGGEDEIGTRNIPEEPEIDGNHGCFKTNDDAPIEATPNPAEEESQNKSCEEMKNLTELVDEFVLQETTQQQKRADAKERSKSGVSSKRKTGRIQGGWGGGKGGTGGRDTTTSGGDRGDRVDRGDVNSGRGRARGQDNRGFQDNRGRGRGRERGNGGGGGGGVVVGVGVVNGDESSSRSSSSRSGGGGRGSSVSQTPPSPKETQTSKSKPKPLAPPPEPEYSDDEY